MSIIEYLLKNETQFNYCSFSCPYIKDKPTSTLTFGCSSRLGGKRDNGDKQRAKVASFSRFHIVYIQEFD